MHDKAAHAGQARRRTPSRFTTTTYASSCYFAHPRRAQPGDGGMAGGPEGGRAPLTLKQQQRKQQREERDAKAAAEISKDKRFAAVLTDPRFSGGLNRARRTLAIDDRFASACGVRWCCSHA